MRDRALVIQTLRELSGWLEVSPGNKQRIDQVIARLERGPLREGERRELKRLLSHDGMFHVRWLGDVYVPDFAGEGPGIPWWNYLSKVAEICQKNL